MYEEPANLIHVCRNLLQGFSFKKKYEPVDLLFDLP